MPFGLNLCPATYKALMQRILGELCYKTSIVYIDDLIIFGRNYEEAYERLVQVLVKLGEAGTSVAYSDSLCNF